MPVVRAILSAALGAAVMLGIQYLSTGGVDPLGQMLVTGVLIGLLGNWSDTRAKRRMRR